ncbi:hypothetical protein [Glycomyces sp. NPDC047010]|uniref:hypothetical protein n=1 Tax=Glycomyces sp. NPDC047010 TaxID=3155023 RepID=UPI0033E2BC44
MLQHSAECILDAVRVVVACVFFTLVFIIIVLTVLWLVENDLPVWQAVVAVNVVLGGLGAFIVRLRKK